MRQSLSEFGGGALLEPLYMPGHVGSQSDPVAIGLQHPDRFVRFWVFKSLCTLVGLA
jgi:hypothetical protein